MFLFFFYSLPFSYDIAVYGAVKLIHLMYESYLLSGELIIFYFNASSYLTIYIHNQIYIHVLITLSAKTVGKPHIYVLSNPVGNHNWDGTMELTIKPPTDVIRITLLLPSLWEIEDH